ncbi:MAG: heavy metal-binding domain-containing protein [Bacteroidales bacterium]
MRILKTTLTIAALATVPFVTLSCDNKKASTNAHDHDHSQKTEQKAEKGKEYTSAYVCPMHCKGSGSKEAGKCPKCGMDYVKNNTHACSMHPEVKGIDGDKCSKCGMKLTPIATYACPMHPEITGAKGDKCSKCGMELKLVVPKGQDHKGHKH